MGAERFSKALRPSDDRALRRRPTGMPRVSLHTPAPDFELADFHGRSFRLSDLRGQKNVLLVFNRGFT